MKSFFESFFVVVKELPKPVRYGSVFYIGSILVDNAVGSYVNSKDYLQKYRTDQLLENEKKVINSDWEAVKYGANKNWCERLWNAVIWPVTLANNIVPFLVLYLNKKTN